MKMKLFLWCATGWLIALTTAQAATLYVDAASTNAVPPFADWTTAAATIQDAVDAAAPGDEIVVTNGVYQTGARAVYGMSNRVAVTKAVTVRSVNGMTYTSIVGYGPNGDTAIRCAYLTNGAVLVGFTLTNGATQADEDTGNWYKNRSGGGVWCEGLGAVVSNSLITGCSAAEDGGGVCSGSLSNCTLTGNSAGLVGGGAIYARLQGCVITRNYGGDFGGGASRSTLDNCVLTGNSASYGGGTAWSTLTNCTLTGNTAYEGGGAYECSMNNCTLVGNQGYDGGGGVYYGRLNNCIVHYNSSHNGPNYSSTTMNYSTTTPLHGGSGNITDAPLFVDASGWSNLRLQSNSSCINAGNNASVAISTDLDGRPRIVGGVVDMGAYEYQGVGTGEFFGWLQHYLLPTDGTADFLDGDGDRSNNWQEYGGGTDPTNALSVLRLLPPTRTGADVTLTWLSVTNRTYALERSTNLAAIPSFTTLATNLPGQPGFTSWTDTNAPVSSPRFYQLRVSP